MWEPRTVTYEVWLWGRERVSKAATSQQLLATHRRSVEKEKHGFGYPLPPRRTGDCLCRQRTPLFKYPLTLSGRLPRETGHKACGGKQENLLCPTPNKEVDRPTSSHQGCPYWFLSTAVLLWLQNLEWITLENTRPKGQENLAIHTYFPTVSTKEVLAKQTLDYAVTSLNSWPSLNNPQKLREENVISTSFEPSSGGKKEPMPAGGY